MTKTKKINTMPSLDSYINFSILLDKSASTPELKFIDTGNYPYGVPVTLIGYFVVMQPDGFSVQVGSIATPSIYWNSGALTQPTTELRLNTANTFQSGDYTIQYFIQAPGYDPTTLTKEVNITYIMPVQKLVKEFDLFTPLLEVEDGTTYTQAGMTLNGTVRAWIATIITVNGSSENVSSSAGVFDLNYGGSYYDSRYDVSLTANPQYTLTSPYTWVSLVDKLAITATYYAEIPPTIPELLNSLTEYKYKIDTCICGKGCGCNDCQMDKDNYKLAVSIYTHMVDRGQINDVDGLSLYVLQLQKLLNNCVTPTYINTNTVIPPYDFGGGSGGSTAWDDITGKPSTVNIQWTVGAMGFPTNGATVLTDSRLANIPVTRVLVFRNNALQFYSDQGLGNTFITKANTAADTIIFSSPLNTGEEIITLILPL